MRRKPLHRRGEDDLVHWVMHATMTMSACSRGAGGGHSQYIVRCESAGLDEPITCLWCLAHQQEEEFHGVIA